MRKIHSLIILGLSIAFYSCNEPSKTKPNILIINADDLGYGDLGTYGATHVSTPNIDQLASEGKKYSDAHSASAVCSPSRYGLLTGKYPVSRNLWGPVGMGLPLAIDTSLTTIASLLKENGYQTACIGKWHLGFGIDKADYNGLLKPGPLELGFGYYFGVPTVNSGPPFVYVENHKVVGYDPEDPFVKGKKSETEIWPAKNGINAIGGADRAHSLYKDELVGTTLKDKTIEWLRKHKESDTGDPFFLYLATTNIHHPFTPAPRFKGTSNAGIYGDFIHELDWIVGEILSELKTLGYSENTMVIFTSDNGGMLNHGGQSAWELGHKLNGPFLGFKFGAWEGGHRIPLIVKWPGMIPENTTSNTLVSQVDFLPTFAGITHTKLENESFDGVNILPSLLGERVDLNRELLLISPNNPSHLTVRKDEWVYIPAQNEGGFKGKKWGDHILGGAAATKFTNQINSDIDSGKIKKGAPLTQLYNLNEDPYQTSNVSNKFPEIIEEMQKTVDRYNEKRKAHPETGWINR